MKAILLILMLLAPQAGAYTPPRDTAGPVTLRIEGPATVTEPGKPFTVTFVLESTAAVSGVLSAAGIDGWNAAPREMKFEAGPGVALRREITVTPAAGAYSAHYPVHGYARFQYQGKAMTAHPVLVVETKFPTVARVARVRPWETFTLAPSTGVAVWRLPAQRTVIQVFGQQALTMPTGWEGTADPSKASIQFNQKIDRGGTRECIAIHPPWADGQVGTAFIEFPIALPVGQPVKLKFAIAVRDGAGDGVTFRVRVVALDAPAATQGEIAFERHSDAKKWLDGEADLSKWAGLSLRLQLESHPGPKNNTSFDHSYWAEPVLTAGEPKQAGTFEAARKLGAAGSVQLGSRGLLNARVGVGELSFEGFGIRVLGEALDDWRSPNALTEWKEEPAQGRLRIRHKFRTLDLLGEIWGDAAAVHARFWLEKAPKPEPWRVAYIEDASLGRWSAAVKNVYQGVGNIIVQPAAFRMGFDGHRLATSFIGADFEGGAAVVQAVDLPPTEMEFDPARGIWTLHGAHSTEFTIVTAKNVWAAVKVWRGGNGLKAAGGVNKLAGRFVFDLWGGQYAEASAALKHAAAYGLTDSAVVWHNWQRWGYDVRLPDIFPPNPQRGAEAELKELARTAKSNGMLFAPHDNYIDFYPDADGFSFEHIAFRPTGGPVPAWLNKGAKAQSYRWQTTDYCPFLERNLKLIRDSFAPDAFFIDVWSSVGPYDSWTQSGGFIDRVATRDAWRKSFAWIRDFLGNNAPQISESGHDQLIGWLDGAQANHLRVDTPPAGEMNWTVWNYRCKDSERIPWFDAAHHDKFVLHGAGYENRYAGGLDVANHGMYSDDYITTEVMTAHPAMVKQPFGRDVVRKYYLLAPLMKALALATLESVEFDGGDPHRQHIRWSKGEAWVNRGPGRWNVGGHALPQYGFYAKAGAVEAAIEQRGGGTVEWSRAKGVLYLNSRGSAVEFEKVLTDGAVRMTEQPNSVTITPLPGSKAFTLRAPLWMAGREMRAINESGQTIKRVPMALRNGTVTLDVEPGVFGYVVDGKGGAWVQPAER